MLHMQSTYSAHTTGGLSPYPSLPFVSQARIPACSRAAAAAEGRRPQGRGSAAGPAADAGAGTIAARAARGCLAEGAQFCAARPEAQLRCSCSSQCYMHYRRESRLIVTLSKSLETASAFVAEHVQPACCSMCGPAADVCHRMRTDQQYTSRRDTGIERTRTGSRCLREFSATACCR